MNPAIREIVVGVATGVISAAIIGIVPFLIQWKWRRQDRRDADRAEIRSASAGLCALVAECLANHEMLLPSGRFSTVMILKNISAIKAERERVCSRLDNAKSACLRGLVDDYTRYEDYKEHPELSVARARAILGFCGG
jgi:hypothetical protein